MQGFLQTGITFGLTSAVITTLGLMVGLHSGTHSRVVVLVSLVWGMSILAILSYAVAKAQGAAPWKIVGEHLLIALVVIGITQLVGNWVSTFGG